MKGITVNSMLKKNLKLAPFLLTALFIASCASTGTLVDSRDGKTYKTVQVGEQTWMAENVNYKTKEGSHCFDCKKYGRLYEWNAAQDACPEGWHLPTKKEWKNFYSHLTHPEMLKASSDWTNYNSNDIDYYGFSVLPAGRYDDGNLKDRGNYAQFWSADVNEGPYFVPGNNTNWSKISGGDAAVSVRCIQGISENTGVIAKRIRPTFGEFVDSRDDKKYKTVKINDQEWMVQNLSFVTKDSRCLPENGNCEESGLSYVWNDAKDACPEGWHIPNDDEWNVLAMLLSGNEPIFSSDYDYNQSYSYKVKKDGFDSLSFHLFSQVKFWSSTPIDSRFENYSTWKFQTYFNEKSIVRYSTHKGGYVAIRCLRGEKTKSELEEKLFKVAKQLDDFKSNRNEKVKWVDDSRDGKKYRTIKIGNQTWMAENLNFSVESSGYRFDGVFDEKCYANDVENCNLLGRLYDYPGRIEMQLCPNGWHVPTDAEWHLLIQSVESQGYDVFDKLFIIQSGYGYRVDDWRELLFDGLGNDVYFWKADSSRYSELHFSKDSVGNSVISVPDEEFSGLVSIRCIENPTTGTFKDSRDGKTYKTVKYANKVWMAENLNYKTNGSYCYDDDNSNCKNKGRLYTWAAAKSACPVGWRLPTIEELVNVFDTRYGFSKSGRISHIRKFLKRGAWRDSTSNEFNFSIIPSGLRNINGSYQYGNEGGTASIWSSSQDPDNENDDDYYFYVDLGGQTSSKESGSEFLGLSVRCVKK